MESIFTRHTRGGTPGLCKGGPSELSGEQPKKALAIDLHGDYALNLTSIAILEAKIHQ